MLLVLSTGVVGADGVVAGATGVVATGTIAGALFATPAPDLIGPMIVPSDPICVPFAPGV